MNTRRAFLLLCSLLGAATLRAGVGTRILAMDGSGVNYQVILASPSVSSPIKVLVVDDDELTGTAPASLTVFLTAQRYDPGLGFYVTLSPSEIQFSTDNFATTVTSLPISLGGTESAPFKVRSSTTGYVSITLRAAGFTPFDQYTWYTLNPVLPSTAQFTSVGLRTDSQPVSAATQTVVTITPDQDGVNDAAVITAVPPDLNNNWEILISTLPFSNPLAVLPPNLVRRFYLYGNDPMYWYGENEFQSWRTVDNGTYTVRLQMPGGSVVNDALSIRVQTSFIKGVAVVLPSSAPLANADINCFGPGGGGSARTGADGKFFVGGLKPGQNYTVEVRAPGFATKRVLGVPSNSDMGLVGVESGAFIRVHATISGGAPVSDIWGGANANDAAYLSPAQGSVHLPSGATESDNGYWDMSDPVLFSTWTTLSVLPNTAYTVSVHLPEFGSVTTSTTTGAGGSFTDLVLSFAKKANVYGFVTLPQPANTPNGGEWVGVDATRVGNTQPSVWGDAFIPNGSSSATYRLSGVSTGTYTLATRSQGYVSQTITSFFVPNDNDIGDSVNGGADFPPLTEGDKIMGTVTVAGDTSGISSSGWGCTPTQFSMYLNASSPQTFQGSSAQICLEKDLVQTSQTYTLKGLQSGNTYRMYTYLQGFQLNPPGQINVTLSSPTATRDINLLAFSGSLDLSVNVAGDPTQVAYYVSANGGEFSGPAKTGNLTSSSSTLITGLATGLYRVELTDNNPGKGLQKTAGVAVTNGSSSTLSMDMTDPTYSLSGSITMQGAVVLPPPFNVTVSSAVGLLSAAQGVSGSSAPAVYVESMSGSLRKLVQATSTLPSGDLAFNVSGLTSGSYRVSVCPDMMASFNCPGSGAFASTVEPGFILDASTGGIVLSLSNGVKVSGTLYRPSGDTSVDNRDFMIDFSQDRGSVHFSTSVSLSGVASAPFSFSHVPAGSYSLQVNEMSNPRKYAAAPLRVTVAGSDVAGQDATLILSGQIVGKLRDADTNTLLTAQNQTQFISYNFNINAQANPYVSGAYGQAEYGMNGIYISTGTGQFSLTGLTPGAEYDVFFQSFNGGGESDAQGLKTYAPVVVSGVRVSAAGQVVDIGTVDLDQGVEISGTVTDSAGTPLPNIQVRARPSVRENHFGQDASASTNAQGFYVLKGLSRDQRYFDIIASPRFEGGDIFSSLPGPKYAEEVLRMVDVKDDAQLQNRDFRLSWANGILTGVVVTEDGGPLAEPFSEGSGIRDRGASVFIHQEGTMMDDNPLGEIRATTDQTGHFSVNALKPAAYTVKVMSAGYAMSLKNVVVSSGTNDLGTVVLRKGAKCSGTLVKPDGSSPSSDELNGIVAVDDTFREFVFGNLQTSGDSVTGYSLDGFKTGPSYSIIAFGDDDTLLGLKSGLTFAANESKVVNLVYKPSPPAVFATQSRQGNNFSIRFFSTHKLRNLTAADNDLDQIVTLTQGAGTILSKTLNSSRDAVNVVYQAAPNESSFEIHLAFVSNLKDLESPTGDNFSFAGDYIFYGGVLNSRVVQIPNATGGTCALEGETTSAGFPSGSFDVAGSSQVEVGVRNVANLSDLDNIPSNAPKLKMKGRAYAQSVAVLAQRLGASAYPSKGLFKAVSAAASVSPFSSFYDFFLPAGVSHTLKKDALITLKYSDGADPAAINVYYFDPGNGVYLLEDGQRQVDTVNKTITVAVRHLSTFVVLPANAPVITGDAFTGTEVVAHNFPNPFNLKAKVVELLRGSSATQNTEGTMIRLGVPPGKNGALRIEIYDAAGALVREMTDTVVGGTYAYKDWDGRNQGGKKVASGVYLARVTINDGDEKFFKMAVIK